METFVLYRHIRPDKNEPFYIGIGKHSRAYEFKPNSKDNRNKIWRDIYNKNNSQFGVDILFENMSWAEACEREKWWIKLYGRVDQGTGCLANLTDGGDGVVGLKWSQESRDQIKKDRIGRKSSPESVAKRSATIIAKQSHLSEEHKEKLRVSKLGSNNPMFGKSNTAALEKAHKAACRKVLNTVTGEIFDSIKSAAASTPYSAAYLMRVLSGRRKNKTNLIKLK